MLDFLIAHLKELREVIPIIRVRVLLWLEMSWWAYAKNLIDFQNGNGEYKIILILQVINKCFCICDHGNRRNQIYPWSIFSPLPSQRSHPFKIQSTALFWTEIDGQLIGHRFKAWSCDHLAGVPARSARSLTAPFPLGSLNSVVEADTSWTLFWLSSKTGQALADNG